jgi:hypothetical protein
VADPSETTQVSAAPDARPPDEADVLDAVRELSAQVAVLQADVHAIRAQARQLPAAARDTPGWEEGPGDARPAVGWVRSLDSPPARRPAIPWLLLEIAFLAAVAVAAAVADLDTAVIVLVMGGAWALVALVEWTAARAARRQAEAAYAPLAALGAGFVSDPSWFAPPVERTALDAVEDNASTGAKLPAADD